MSIRICGGDRRLRESVHHYQRGVSGISCGAGYLIAGGTGQQWIATGGEKEEKRNEHNEGKTKKADRKTVERIPGQTAGKDWKAWTRTGRKC